MQWRFRTTRRDTLRADVHELGRRFDEVSQQTRDELQITREVIRRNEIAFREQMRALNSQTEHLDGLLAESRAMREGFLALIDELRRGGPDPAPS